MPQSISIHALLAESDSSRLRIKSRLAYISIHAFLAESDGCVERSCKGITIFLSTLSLRRATVSKLAYYSPSPFLSTLSLRRATIPSNGTLRRTHISIHALLAESDTSSTRNQPSRPISIHALLAESDYRAAEPPQPGRYFYPRSPCGERLCAVGAVIPQQGISIHALLAESDGQAGAIRHGKSKFLSTLSLRRATSWTHWPTSRHSNFYPRSPCGERHAHNFPTLHDIFISIHALLAESDVLSLPFGAVWIDFYPRSPCGERRGWGLSPLACTAISIHALLAESDDR